jgi:MoaA/NifB/PqqE/SkfB family radical SAM enzyme
VQCPAIPEIDLAEWGGELESKLKGQRYPYSATFEITDRCNFACVHCYINQPAGNRPARAQELSTSQVMGVLDQIAAAGTLFLTITGGDPLVRADFPEIYKHARNLGLVVSLFTNGSLITPEIADLLVDYTPRVVDITLYGATQMTYERVTRTTGSFARVQRGVQLLLERGVPLSLKTVLLTINQHEFKAIQAFAEQLGVKFRYDRLLWPRLDGGQSPLEYQIPLEAVIALEFRDPESKKD